MRIDFERGATWTHVKPEEVTTDERRLIIEGDLGYCESHWILYRKRALSSCVAGLLSCKCDDPTHHNKQKDIGLCKEWFFTRGRFK